MQTKNSTAACNTNATGPLNSIRIETRLRVESAWYCRTGPESVGPLRASGKLVFDSKTETPTQRAYRECGLCGIPAPEIDQYIDDCHHSTLNREELIGLFEATFGPDDDQKEAFMPCVEAILDAAEDTDTGERS